jgi:hypothetical protein
MARLSKNESSCEKNQHGMPKPCLNDHITLMSHVLKLERGMNTTRLHKTPHIRSFLRFTEGRSKLSLTLCTSNYVTLTYLNDLHKWSRQYIYIYIHILHGFKTSSDAFRFPYSIAFDCSIRPI